MKHDRFLTFGGIALLASLLPSPLFSETVTLNPVADTTLHEISPNHNMGSHTHVAAGTTGRQTRVRGLYRFDLGDSIPPNAEIQSVTFSVRVTGVPATGGTPSTFEVRRVLVDWNEGNKTGNTGSPAGSGETTWNNRIPPDTAWASPGGAIGSDYADTISATTDVQGIGSYTFGSSPEMIADVEGWVADPSTNFGWMLRTQSEQTLHTARRFSSQEGSGSPPALTITFEMPATDIEITAIQVNDGQITLEWIGGSPPYTIQQATDVAASQWQELSSGLTTTSHSFPANGSQGFFRIVN